MPAYRTKDSEATISNLQEKVEKLEKKLKRRIEIAETMRSWRWNVKNWWFNNGEPICVFGFLGLVLFGGFFGIYKLNEYVVSKCVAQCETHGQIYEGSSSNANAIICRDQAGNLYVYRSHND